MSIGKTCHYVRLEIYIEKLAQMFHKILAINSNDKSSLMGKCKDDFLSL